MFEYRITITVLTETGKQYLTWFRNFDTDKQASSWGDEMRQELQRDHPKWQLTGQIKVEVIGLH